MKIGDTVLWKGKPAKIFGTYSEGLKLRRFYIMMLNKRRRPGIYHVSVKSKHLKLAECRTQYLSLISFHAVQYQYPNRKRGDVEYSKQTQNIQASEYKSKAPGNCCQCGNVHLRPGAFHVWYTFLEETLCQKRFQQPTSQLSGIGAGFFLWYTMHSLTTAGGSRGSKSRGEPVNVEENFAVSGTR